MEPRKWLKHQQLVTWGLRTKEDLETSIKRYNFVEHNKMFTDIEIDMATDNGKSIYIGICVPQKQFLNLPNLKMKTQNDIEQAQRKLKTLGYNNFAEIWYCKNSLQQGNSLYGRQAFELDELFPRIAPSTIEVIKGSSAREIDDLSKHIEIPEFIREKLCSYKKRIADFGEFLKSINCRQLAVEFSYIDNSFKFIDWDSDNDEKVLNELER